LKRWEQEVFDGDPVGNGRVGLYGRWCHGGTTPRGRRSSNRNLICNDQFADFTVKEVKVASGAVYQHWGTASYGDRLKDIRARTFALIFIDTLNKDVRNSLINQNAVVFRARYNCSQACQVDVAAEAAARGKEYIPKSMYDVNSGEIHILKRCGVSFQTDYYIGNTGRRRV
jgi:hypothetical protein